jgi:hypothetical protein
MSVSTLGVGVEHRSDGSYIQVQVADGSIAIVGPVDLTKPQYLTGVLIKPMLASSQNAKKQRRRSIAQEDEIAERQGGQRVRGSGARAGHKGDVRKVGIFRLEAKYTKKKSYRISHDDLRKIRSEATNLEVPLLEVHFLDPATDRTYDRWVLIDARYFQHMEYKPPYATTLHR